MPHVRPALILWLLVYLGCMVGVVVLMLQLRETTIAAFGTPEQQQNWDDWREAAREPEGGVTRREPASGEPPALVLMRDYFPMCMASALLFGSVLYVMCTVLIAGALGGAGRPAEGNRRGKGGTRP